MEKNTNSLEDVMNTVDKKKTEATPKKAGTSAENDAAFNSLPKAIRDSLKAGKSIDSEIDDIDAALAENEQKGLEVVNSARSTLNLPPVSSEDIKAGLHNSKPSYSDDDDDMSSITEEFDRKLAELNKENYDEPDESIDPETADEKRLRAFEKELAESIIMPRNKTNDNDELNTAPLHYTIKRNTEYDEVLKTTLADNNIKFKTNKKGNLKSALLRNFVNRHPNVTTPLINSGFHVTMSGASIPSIIQMNSIQGVRGSELEMVKLGYIAKHIVDSSIGKKLSTLQLMKTVFHKDLQTLYFNFILGTLPEEFEYPVVCDNKKCHQDMRLQLKASDLILNADEFEDVSKYILYEGSDIQDVISYSKVSKEKRLMIESTKVVVTIINPTIYDSMFVTSEIEKAGANLLIYQDLLGYLLYVKNVAMYDPETGEWVPFSTLEEILEVLSAFSTTELEELDAEIKEYSLTNTVKYGIRSFTCPKCGKVHPQAEFDLSTMLFIASQLEAMKSRLSVLNQKQQSKEQ